MLDNRKYSQLLDHITCGQWKAAELLLDKDLARLKNDSGTLLHHAAKWNDEKISRLLIKLGADVNCQNSNGATPLSLATYTNSTKVVKFLLESNADMYIADHQGQTPLKIALEESHICESVVFLYLDKLCAQVSTFDDIIKILLDANCSIYNAIFLDNHELIECLLDRNICNISWRNHEGKTALHLAVELEDMKLIELLTSKGRADVNALDNRRHSPLFDATTSINVDIVRHLLENSANPNVWDYEGVTPLLIALSGNSRDSPKCVELLLQYDADAVFCFNLASEFSPDNCASIKILIAHLALILKMKRSINEHERIVQRLSSENPYCLIGDYYKLCENLLDSCVLDETLSLLSLLMIGDVAMRSKVRDAEFSRRIEEALCKNGIKKLCPYYCNRLMMHMSKAHDMLELEGKAIDVLAKVFNSNYNECYEFGRQVIGQLNDHELEQLCRIYE